MIKNGQSMPKEFCETADICISSCGEQAEIAQMGLADKESIRSAEAKGACSAGALNSLNTYHQRPRQECDAYFMAQAINQARSAELLDEVPIGAVVVFEGCIIAQAGNRRETDADPAGHAEFLALKRAAEVLGAWRLSGCTVYVTLEPCIMCAGLMHQARIDRCVFGAFDPKAGALGSLYQVHADTRLNHQFEVTAGVCETECAQLLKSFFTKKRRLKKAQKATEKGQ